MTLLTERRELLERFRRGERRALEEVYRHYVSDVANFLSRGFSFTSRDRTLRFVGYTEPFDLDNAIQETFARAFKESARLGYDGLNSYKNYLLAITRNLVIDEFRNREVAMSPFIDQIASPDVSDRIPVAAHDGEEAPAVGARGGGGGSPAGGSAEQDYLRDELSRLYAGFVERLDDRDRTFFRARFEEQLTQVEAGERCGLSHMQARTLEKKLRERFLKHMHANGYLETYGASGRDPVKSGI
jgi:RNA polymerase sigma factor (sigma-70 family)